MEINLASRYIDYAASPNSLTVLGRDAANGGVETVTDPGNAGTITPPAGALIFKCSITTAGVETRVLGAPDFAGQRAIVVFGTDGGNFTMTNTAGWLDGATSDDVATFDDAGDSMICEAHGTAATDWRVTSDKGVAFG